MWSGKQRNLILPVIFLLILQVAGCKNDPHTDWYNQLKVDFTGDAKIEVGGPYAGVEFHHSSCVPQRISFFYPAANSIDLSTDYWHRDTTFVMALGLRIGDGEKEWLGDKPFTFSLTPYKVTFSRENEQAAIRISYQFTKTQPAMVITYQIKNLSQKTDKFQFDTHLAASLRTSHTFKRIDRAWTEYDAESGTIYVNHPDPETQKVQMFVGNAANPPVNYYTAGPLNAFLPDDTDQWPAEGQLVPESSPGETAARFLYQADLNPGESLTVMQIIGTAAAGEGRSVVDRLHADLAEEISAYEHGLLDDIFEKDIIRTEDQELNHSVHWARAVLDANQHYIDGEIVPMPCPAEYNFYFTHDVLVTDLAVVNFEPQRVKRDLDFIVRHANPEKIIPHAYYWKDSSYVTEYADKDNWNNFWMIIASATYLRHSGDSSYVRHLYPYIKKCLQTALLNRENDNLMWSNRPDWWDIGKNYGPRSYMTVLAIKAIRDYLYIGSMLGIDPEELAQRAVLADAMQKALNEHLWDDGMGYLVNYYQDGSLDPHYYIGSLLAAHYDLLDSQRCKTLVSSAGENLLDPKIGIYNAYPMDFHELIDYLKFAGNEAGAKGYYANGGIWPQGNAWYALALIADGARDESYAFVKRTMTLTGIMAGPNGQPAMYEVRNSDRSDPVAYGTVDKPQFLWAGAWYLYTLYHLFAVDEDSWNISFAPYLPEEFSSGMYRIYAHGRNLNLSVNGSGTTVKEIRYDGVAFPSAIIPSEIGTVNDIEIDLGQPDAPRLKYSNSVLISSAYAPKDKKLTLKLKAFRGHANRTVIQCPIPVKSILCDGEDVTGAAVQVKKDGFSEYTILSDHKNAEKVLVIKFD